MLDVQRSMFDVHFLVNPSHETVQGQSFFFDQTGRFFRPVAGLNLDPLTL
jgi:hypothetical protein